MSFVNKSLVWIFSIFLIFMIYWHFNGTVSIQTVLLLFTLCFFSELIDGSIGMGYGTILMPLLLFMDFSPAEIVPNLLISELLTGFSAAFFHHQIKNVDLDFRSKSSRIAALLIIGSLLGVVGGVWVAISIPKNIAVLLIGSIIAFSGFVVLIFYDKVIIYRTWKILLLSTVASFNKAFSGAGYGPLVTSGQILSGIKGKSSVAITSLAEGFTCLFGAIGFYLVGVEIDFLLLAPMLAGGLISVPLSAFLVHRIDETHLRLVVGIGAILLGLGTIYHAL